MADIRTITVNGVTYNIDDANAEQKANKVTSITAQSTNEQYPSALAVWNAMSDIGGDTEIIQENYIRINANDWLDISVDPSVYDYYVTAYPPSKDYPFVTIIHMDNIDRNWYAIVTPDYETSISGNLCNQCFTESGEASVILLFATEPIDCMLESVVCLHKKDYVEPETHMVTVKFPQENYPDVPFDKMTVSGAGKVVAGESTTVSVRVDGMTVDEWIASMDWSDICRIDGFYINGTRVSATSDYTFTPTDDTELEFWLDWEVTIVLTDEGTFNNSRCYVKENNASGTTHYTAGDEFNLWLTESLYCYTKAYSSSYSSEIHINDEVVASHTKSTTATTYTLRLKDLFIEADVDPNYNAVAVEGQYATNKNAILWVWPEPYN